jgi:ATP-binding cassette subfamily B protein
MAVRDSSVRVVKGARNVRRAVGFVAEAAPGWSLLGAGLVILQGLLPLASLYLMKLIVDAVIAGVAAPDPKAAFARIAAYVGLAAGVALATAALQSAGQFVKEAQGLRVADHMTGMLHAKSVEVDLAYYEDPRYFDTLHRAQEEAPYRPVAIVGGLLQIGQATVSLAAMAALLVTLHWGVALVLVAATVPGVLVKAGTARARYRWRRARTARERLAGYFGWLLTHPTYAKEVRLFGLGAPFMRRFRDVRGELRREILAISARRSALDLATQAVATAAVFGSYGFIAHRALGGAITVGGLVMYFQAFQRGLGSLRDVLGGLADLYEHNLFLANLVEFLGLDTKVREPDRPAPIPRPIRRGVVFDGVWFRYPSTTRDVLRDVRLTIGAGEIVALVGDNGSGKTTLVKLLCRLYDPTAGSITLDGTDLRRFGVAELRREIGVLFQDYARYDLTAAENIRIGDAELSEGDPRVAEAARAAGADAIIARLPHGYATTLGAMFEDGEQLSVGEWQKIALARAFVRDAQLVVLDEPTSSLDAKSEFEAFTRFRRLATGRSGILISHRFSTVRMADRIYVLEDGTIAEAGTHAELIRRGGTYARLFDLQAAPYREPPE